MPKTSLIVIPARMGSSRYPNKPLARILGTTMIERVWRIGCASTEADEVVIATDSIEIKQHAESFGAKVVMTPSDCPTGSDRVADTAKLLGDKFDICFSLQGDAVLTPPWVIDDVIRVMLQESNARIATPAVLLKGDTLAQYYAAKQAKASSGTSVVFDKNHNALYFSNTFLPHPRQGLKENLPIYRHIGLYGYQRETLEQFRHLPEGKLEKVEQLEQLRALENGIPIRVVIVDYQGRTHGSVDCPEDIAKVETIIRKEGELVL